MSGAGNVPDTAEWPCAGIGRPGSDAAAEMCSDEIGIGLAGRETRGVDGRDVAGPNSVSIGTWVETLPLSAGGAGGGATESLFDGASLFPAATTPDTSRRRGGPNLMEGHANDSFASKLAANFPFPFADGPGAAFVDLEAEGGSLADPEVEEVERAVEAGSIALVIRRGAMSFTRLSSTFRGASSMVCTSNPSNFSAPASPAESTPSGRVLSRQS